MIMSIERRDLITRDMLMAERATLFVFGDNLARWGKGGQAAAMRDEPNAVGLPTKRSPYAFLTDRDLGSIKEATKRDIKRLEFQLIGGGVVVWPAAGIGTGRAELAARAPAVLVFYEALLMRLIAIGQTA